jgi:RimJ/RimL family protein N-acetyltransferase
MGRPGPLSGAEDPESGVILRPATDQDAVHLLEWRNDPDSVRFSVTRRAVDPGEHERWLESRLEHPEAHLWIAEQAGIAVGQVRVDIEHGTGIVSIAVAPEHRGRGLSSLILRAMVAEVGRSGAILRLRARVDPENLASLRAFENAGFQTLVAREEGFAVLERSIPG